MFRSFSFPNVLVHLRLAKFLFRVVSKLLYKTVAPFTLRSIYQHGTTIILARTHAILSLLRLQLQRPRTDEIGTGTYKLSAV